jgi:N-formylglutamate amidohydrolase
MLVFGQLGRTLKDGWGRRRMDDINRTSTSACPATGWFDPPFEVLEPDFIRAPLVFSSPHSGRNYPEPFLQRSRLDPHRLRRSEDCFVDEIFADVVDLGIPLLHAHFPRAYLDVNREPFELDPVMFTEPLPDYVNTGSVRVAGGLGTIARIVSETEEIYDTQLTFAEAEARINALHLPYHRRLTDLLKRARETFGAAVLVDCHSMPSSIPRGAGDGADRPDFILGDRYGSACAGAIVDFVERRLTDLGYTVSRNRPYAGGFITQSYGRPACDMHALQLEMNRSLYMDEENLTKHGGFYRLVDDMLALVSSLQDALALLFGAHQAAAE